MLAYLDASALIKLLIDEPGSDDVADVWHRATALTTSVVAYTEVPAALAAVERARRVDAVGMRRARSLWSAYRRDLGIMRLTTEGAGRAGEIATTLALGALDAIHLDSALVIGGDDTVLVTWDRRLHHAAQRVGLPTLPASL